MTSPLRHYLDLMRLLADPVEKRSAHVTLRGPYRDFLPPKMLEEMNLELNHRYVHVTNLCTFMNGRQRTVYLEAEGAFLRKLWDKPDYPTGLPHLTLYDGTKRDFALQLFGCLSKFKWEFDFEPTELRPLVSGLGQQSFDLLIDLPPAMTGRFLGPETTLVELKRLPDTERLKRIERVASELHGLLSDREVVSSLA